MLKLGLFSMPVHLPNRILAEALQEDREFVILADQLGFSEAWMGEHFTSVGEPIPSPLIFNASVIDAAPNIMLGSGVICLPQQHPAVVAAHVALLDQLSRGRVIFGIGSGGLSSDWEIFDNLDHQARGRAMVESIDAILRLWKGKLPVHHEGEAWQFAIEDHVIPEIGVGQMIKPYQTPHPQIAVSLRGPRSGLARLAGGRGWIPLSGNFIPTADVATHWPTYVDEAEKLRTRVDPNIWRVGRSVLVTESSQQAEDIINDPNGVFTDYYYYLNTHRKLADGSAKAPHDEKIERAEAKELAKELIILGTADEVLGQLIDFYDIVGHFGTLLITGHDISDNPDLWRNSMTTLAKNVAPKFGQHMDSAYK
jgi:alkanesulfonate monooxygenase SsuD/methylene tetrahydromethanopterin reductase-like flavin-dependent oxidoreductase (luciferase family)